MRPEVQKERSRINCYSPVRGSGSILQANFFELLLFSHTITAPALLGFHPWHEESARALRFRRNGSYDPDRERECGSGLS